MRLWVGGNATDVGFLHATFLAETPNVEGCLWSILVGHAVVKEDAVVERLSILQPRLDELDCIDSRQASVYADIFLLEHALESIQVEVLIIHD